MVNCLGVEPLGLQGLLAPKTVEEFLSVDFQKRPFVIRDRDPAIYADLVTLEQVEQLIDTHDPRDGACRLMGGEGSAGRRTVEKSGELTDVLVAYGRGASINVAGLDRRCPAVGELRNQLRADFAAHGIGWTDHGDSVVFITPTTSQALDPHVDPEDLFVLQLAGRKHWKVFAHDPGWKAGENGVLPTPAIDVELAPGDLLYVPQHWIHVAEAGSDYSFHLTMGFRPLSWTDVVSALVNRALFGIAPLSEAVLPWAMVDGKLTPAGRQHATTLLAQLLEAPVLQRALEQLELHPSRRTGPRTSGIAAVNRARELDAATVCSLAAPARVQPHGDGVEIVTAGRKMKGPKAIEPALVWIAEQSSEFAVGSMGGPLTESAKVVLARRLVMEGILQLQRATM